MESIEIVRKSATKSREDFLRELEEQHANALDRAFKAGTMTLENHVVVKSFDEGDRPGIAKRNTKFDSELAEILRNAERNK